LGKERKRAPFVICIFCLFSHSFGKDAIFKWQAQKSRMSKEDTKMSSSFVSEGLGDKVFAKTVTLMAWDQSKFIYMHIASVSNSQCINKFAFVLVIKNCILLLRITDDI
jgi:hypothetical protein